MTNELTVIEKGWQLDPFKMELCYNINDYVVSGTTEEEDKAKLFAREGVCKMKLDNGEPLTLDNMPLIECPGVDVIVLYGEPLRRSQVPEIQKNKAINESRQRLLDNPNITHCYISKRGCYYRSNYKGYTEERYFAGVYKKEDAVNSCSKLFDITLIPVKTEDHNAYLNVIIADLQSRIIIK